MRDDPLAALEYELVSAARRRAGRGGRARPRPGAALGMAASVLVALGVVGVILLVRPAAPAPQRSTAPPAAAAGHPGTPSSIVPLAAELAALRRPQTAADRALPPSLLREPVLSQVMGGKVDLAFTRLAAVTPWGEQVFLVPVVPDGKQLGAAAGATVNPTTPKVAALRRQLAAGARLMVVAGDSVSGGATAAEVKQSGEFAWQGAGRPFARGSTQADLVDVVPDGVVRVGFVFGAQQLPGGGPHQNRLEVTAAVRGNVAAVRVNRNVQSPPLVVWYGAGGVVLNKIDRRALRPAKRPSPP